MNTPSIPTSDTIALVFLLAKATLLLLLAFGAATLLQRASAGARHLVWAATLGAVLILPAIVAWSPLRLAVLPAALLGTTSASSSPTLDPSSLPSLGRTAPATQTPVEPESDPVKPNPDPLDARSVSAAAATSSPWVPNIWQLFLIAWVVVALALSAWLLVGFVSVHRIVRGASRLDSRAWSGPLYEIADRLGIDRTPRVVRSDSVKMPFAAGLLTPTIVLPAECEQWDEERRSAVLMHELAHIRRNDLLGHTLGRIACALYWFHPLVWRAARRLRIESERACDDLALTCGLRASNYAEHLLEIVTSVRKPMTPIVAIPMADRKEFEGRMLAILDPEVRRRAARGQSLAVIAGLAMFAVLVGGAVPAAEARDANGTPLAGSEVRPPAVVGGDTALRNSEEVPRLTTESAPRVRAETRAEPRAQTRAEQQVNVKTLSEEQSNRLSQGVQMAAGVSSGQRAQLANRLQQGASDDRAALLIQVLRTDTSATLRRVAAWGLEQFADRDDVGRALAEALRRDKSSAVREMAAWSMGSGNDGAEVRAALIEALKRDAEAEVRESAAWALGNLAPDGVEEALVAALGDAAPATRAAAMWALGNVGEGKAPSAVVEALGNSDVNMRQLAAWVLFNRQDSSTVPALERALAREQDKSLRLAYIRALGAIGEFSAPALARLLDSPDAEVRSMVVNALAGRNDGSWPMPHPRPRPNP